MLGWPGVLRSMGSVGTNVVDQIFHILLEDGVTSVEVIHGISGRLAKSAPVCGTSVRSVNFT